MPPHRLARPHSRRLGHLPARRRDRRADSVHATRPARPPPPPSGQLDELANRPTALRTGALLVAAGVGVPATQASSQAARTAVTIAFLALAVGALAWAWSVYQRATRIAEFAHGTLPQWPFAAYVLLTIGGLALLAAGLLANHVAPGIAWVTIAADLTFLAAYLSLSDLPPFVFYLLFLAIAAALW